MTYTTLRGMMLAIAFAFGSARLAVAQGEHAISVGADYTYIRTNVLPGCDCFGMNGGGMQFEYGLTPKLSLLGDFTATHQGSVTPDHYALTHFTYTAGIRYRPEIRTRLRPFGDLLLGGAHATGTLSPASTGFGGSNAFAFQTGAGAEISLGKRWTLIPAQVDYLLTTFSNGSANHQNDLRVSAGISYRFGH